MLIKLITRPTKGFCANKFCGYKLKGPFKILQRGKDDAYFVCLKCFKAMARKSHSDFGKYIPNDKGAK